MVYRQKDSFPLQTSLPSSPPPPSSPRSSGGGGGGSRISPAVLFVIVVLAVIFFVSGLLHLLFRFLIKKSPSNSSSHQHHHHHAREPTDSDALQRQLQQLFHLHDSGLDQASIDALPVFLYREIVGSKEPFDCAVCLCEFSRDDQLRLLPACGHAFHLDCIDTWLLSNSTCPLCRGALFVEGEAIENPIFGFEEDSRLEEGEGEGEEAGSEKRVVPVRLGKFRSTGNGNSNGGGGCARIDGAGDADGSRIARREEGESSSSNLDARRCYSMGSYQYIVGDTKLRVALASGDKYTRRGGGGGGGGGREEELCGNLAASVDEDGKRLGAARKGESFSVSKIWLWGNKKGKFPDVSDAASSLDDDRGLPWMNARRSVGDV